MFCRYRANSPQKLPFFGEDIVAFTNPLLHVPPSIGHPLAATNPLAHIAPNGHNNAGWRCVPYNPMMIAVDPLVQHHCPPWEPESRPLPVSKGTKETRSKITVPKPVVVEVSEEDSEDPSDMDESPLGPCNGEEMEQQETPSPECRPVARQVIRPRPHGRRNGGRWNSIRDRRMYEEDYRRFSERSRKKPAFFGIGKRQKNDGNAQKGSRGAQQGKRVVDLGSKPHLHDEKLAGSAEDVATPEKEVGKEAVTVSPCVALKSKKTFR